MIIQRGCVDDVIEVHQQLPEFNEDIKNKLLERLENKQSLILIAVIGERKVGYKLGYQVSEDTFYSWLGGVLPQCRRTGVATKLREYQESWAKEAGFNKVTVKSMNQFPAMLQMLISSGYQIYGYEQAEQVAEGKILFSKMLT